MKVKIKFSNKKLVTVLAVLFILYQTLLNRNSLNLKSFSFTPTPTNNLVFVKVVRVIDGDTIEIEGGQKVRYIGINAPEIYRDITGKKTGEDCFAEEATKENKRLVKGKTVRLEKDVSATDKYKRLLRYVYVDGAFVNDYLIRQGYAKTMTVKPDTKFYSQFKQAEKEAQENLRGIWSSCSIN